MLGRSDTAWVCPINSGVQHYISAIAYVTMLAAFLSAWHWMTTGNLSGSAVAAFVALSSTALIYGRFVLRLSPLSSKLTDTLTLQFLFLAFYYSIRPCLFCLLRLPGVLPFAFWYWSPSVCFCSLLGAGDQGSIAKQRFEFPIYFAY